MIANELDRAAAAAPPKPRDDGEAAAPEVESEAAAAARRWSAATLATLDAEEVLEDAFGSLGVGEQRTLDEELSLGTHGYDEQSSDDEAAAAPASTAAAAAEGVPEETRPIVLLGAAEMLRSALRRSMTSGSGRSSPEPWKRRKGSVVLSPAAAALAAALSALARLYRVARAHVRRGILNDASADVTVISCGAVARLVHACGPEAALGARLDLVHHAPDHALGVATFVASQRGAHARATLEGGGAGVRRGCEPLSVSSAPWGGRRRTRGRPTPPPTAASLARSSSRSRSSSSRRRARPTTASSSRSAARCTTSASSTSERSSPTWRRRRRARASREGRSAVWRWATCRWRRGSTARRPASTRSRRRWRRRGSATCRPKPGRRRRERRRPFLRAYEARRRPR